MIIMGAKCPPIIMKENYGSPIWGSSWLECNTTVNVLHTPKLLMYPTDIFWPIHLFSLSGWANLEATMYTAFPSNQPLIGCDNPDVSYSHQGGVDTLDLSTAVTYDEADQLRNDLLHSGLFRYKQKPEKFKHCVLFTFSPTRSGPNGMSIDILASKVPLRFLAMHPKDIVVVDGQLESMPSSIITVHVKPKRLVGIDDYVTPANADCLVELVDRVNGIFRSVSPVLGTVDDYRLRRTDPCLNIVLHDLLKIHEAKQINRRDIVPLDVMRLVRMGDIPYSYTQYSSPRCTCSKSMWLYNKSVNINFYCKGEELKSKYPDVAGIDLASDVVRLEVQLKYRKMSVMFRDSRLWEDLKDLVFSEDWNVNIVSRYWWRVVGHGDWYSLREAERRISRHGFRIDKEKRMVECLKLVAECGGLAETKKRLSDKEWATLSYPITELRKIGINPVCIPKSWRMTWIPNVLEAWLEQEKSGCIDARGDG